MNIKPIKNKKDYQETLKRIERIWNALPGTPESDELDILATLTEKYEEANYAIAAPDPIEAITFRMEQMGMDKKDLAKIIGANRVSELFSKKRSLSLKMIRNLREKLGIPADSLIGA